GTGAGPLGQLLQPGAVRQALRPAMGGQDRPGPPHASLHRLVDVPADVPVRVDPGRAGLLRADLVHTAVLAAGAVRRGVAPLRGALPPLPRGGVDAPDTER